MFRINVLIVTYKQEDIIGRNIESVLQQKEYGLNKIVICDDCSPDNNWDVIQSYVEKYPEYIVAYRNESNLGIYGNSNKLMTLRGSADFYCWLEGDDALCDGFFKAAQEYLEKHKIKLSEPVALMSDFVIKYDNKRDFIDSRNSIVNRNRNYFGLYLRGLVSWRACLFTKAVMSRFQPAVLNQGLSLAESSFDNQFFRYLKEAIYLPVNGSIYYAGIGVSVALNDVKSEYKTTEGIAQWSYYINGLVNKKQDICWCKANRLKSEFYIKPKLSALFKILFFYFRGMMFTYKLTPTHFKTFFAPLIKSLLDK